MISRILIPTDGSELSARAIGTAMSLAKALGASEGERLKNYTDAHPE